MYDYKSLSAEERINAEGRLYIHATVRVNVSTAEEAVNWLSAFEKSSYSDYRTMKTWGDLETSKRLDFKVCLEKDVLYYSLIFSNLIPLLQFYFFTSFPEKVQMSP